MSAAVDLRRRARDLHEELCADVASFYGDPLGYALWAFPWSKEPFNRLDGPDTWQREVLQEIGAQVRERRFDGKTPVKPIRIAVRSGHGIGKGALSAMLTCWLGDTRANSKGIVTANTVTQLQTKTWAEICKWRKASLTAHWWDVSDGGLYIRHKAAPESWRVDAQTCRKENSEAFAGQHAATSTSWYLFDEASAIPDVIWEVAEGGLTDGHPMIFAWGNPTRNAGKFFDLFTRQRHIWTTRQIDSRTCTLPNKEMIQEWIEEYGEDSDFVRVRVKGEAPRAAGMQVVPSDRIAVARRAEVTTSALEPLVAGLDVARGGECESVLALRRGRDARTYGQHIWRGLDGPQLAGAVARVLEDLRKRNEVVDVVFVDVVGVGASAYDHLRLLNVHCLPVVAGAEAENHRTFANKTTECWWRMRDWFQIAAIVDDPILAGQLERRQYGFKAESQIVLESKKDLAKRGEESPDRADALSLTFAEHVAPRSRPRSATPPTTARPYDPFASRRTR